MKQQVQILINQCKQGDASAQRKLYADYKNLWFTISMRYVIKRDDALDVLQNALIKIYSKLDTFDNELGSFKSWSSRVVINESIMFQRKYWNKPELAVSNLELISETISANAISDLSLEDLTNMIKELPDGYRMVFNLYEIDGYTHREIADMLNISIGTSKSQLFKAKGILKKKLEPIYSDGTKMIS